MKSLKPLGKKGKVRTEAELLAELRGIKTPSESEVDLDKFVVLENIECVDANGRPFEQYDKVYVAKEIELENGESRENNIVEANKILIEKDLSCSSLALTCNILVALYEKGVNVEGENRVKDTELFTLLSGFYSGLSVQNTFIDWGKSVIYHNNHALGFDPDALFTKRGPIISGEFLTPPGQAFYKSLTGLKDPSKLLDIADLFGGDEILIELNEDLIKKGHNSGVNLGYILKSAPNRKYIGIDLSKSRNDTVGRYRGVKLIR